MISNRLHEKYSNYRYCTVRECKNTSIKTPGKLWIKVPNKPNMRNAWLRLARRDPESLSTETHIYFCEDHFDLENDMENYMEYKIMGSVKRIRMKPDCVPLTFKCQNSKKRKHSPGPDQPEDTYKKTEMEENRLLKIGPMEISTSSFLQELLNTDDIIPSCSSSLKQVVQHNTQFRDQAVQVQPMQEHVSCQVTPRYCYKVTQTRHVTHYRSKMVQCSIGMKDAATSPIQPIAQKSTAISTKASGQKSYRPQIFGMGTKCLQFSNYRTIPTLRKMSIDIGGMRIKYKDREETFLEKHLVSKEPFGQFKAWFEEACTRKEILEPNAMCLATATKDGYPSARFVLCKGYGKDGFKFFTNYGSRKAKEMEENPNVAATFYWEILNRSVRIEGHVEKLSDDESTKYFHSRPVPSQIAASTSFQSTPIQSRDVLCEREKVLEAEYMIPEKEIPKPIFWGGYIIRPRAVEFWQGQKDRLHDRIKFRKPKDGEVPDNKLLHEGEDGWVFERLSP